MTTRQQMDNFHRFAVDQIDNGGAEPTIDELYQHWRMADPTDSERTETVAAVQAAYADFEAGENGQPARQELRETWKRLGLVAQDKTWR